MKILLITDIHYGKDSGYAVKDPSWKGSYGSRFEEILASLLDQIKNHDLVINLGDIIQDEDEKTDFAQYIKIHNLLSETSTPIKHCLGNHDVRYLSREVLAEINGEEKSYYSFEMGGYTHIVLDPVRKIFPNDPDEEKFQPILPNEQVNFLKEILSETQSPVFLYCHYPFDESSHEKSYYFKEKPKRALVRNREEVRKILENFDQQVIVFNGHTHFHNESAINSVRYITLPGFSEDRGDGEPNRKILSVETDGEKVDYELIELTSKPQ